MSLTAGERYPLTDGRSVSMFANEGGRAWGIISGETVGRPFDEDTGIALQPGQPDVVLPSDRPPLPLSQALRDAWNGAETVDDGIRRVWNAALDEWENADSAYRAEFLARALQAGDPLPPPILTRPQFRFFLGETGLDDLYDAGVAALLASPDPDDRYAGQVALNGTAFYWYPTLAFGTAAAAAQTPPVTLDAVALRAAWDAAALMQIGA